MPTITLADGVAEVVIVPSLGPELAGNLRLANRLLGDVFLATLTREDVVRMRTRLLCLPSDHKNLWFDREKRRERSFEELLLHVDEIEKTKKLDRVKPETWNRLCGTYKAFVDHIKSTRTAAKGTENVVEGLFYRSRKTR